jgi:hypothetical protein
MQGIELIDRLLLGQPEKTAGMVYAITEDGRPALAHERAPHAGSGEKRPRPAAAPEVIVVQGDPERVAAPAL